MKTNNLAIELMVPSQLNKDIIFNESMLKIDCFLNMSITSFIETINDDMHIDEKYIVKYGEHVNQICYKTIESKPLQFLTPQKGMIVYVLNQDFFYFDGSMWQQCSSKICPKQFLGVSDFHVIYNELNYLYLNADTEFKIDSNNNEITIFIKQSAENNFQISWPANILWENKIVHTLTQAKNSIDLIKLYYLPETHHYLGKIIAQNFNY